MPPISLVESSGLRELVQSLGPEYIMPSRATVTKHMEKHFEKKKDELKVRLARVDKLMVLVQDCES